MTDGGGAGAVGGKSLSSLDIIHQETSSSSSSSSLLNNKRNDDDDEDEGRSPLWLIFFLRNELRQQFPTFDSVQRGIRLTGIFDSTRRAATGTHSTISSHCCTQ